MVLEAETMQTGFYQLRGQFAVGGVHRQQSAAHNALRRSTFIHIDVSGLGTHHSFMRVCHGINAQRVATRSVEGKENPRLLAELFTELRLSGGTIFIIAVCQGMVLIHTGDGFQNLWANARMVITSESSFHNYFDYGTTRLRDYGTNQSLEVP